MLYIKQLFKVSNNWTHNLRARFTLGIYSRKRSAWALYQLSIISQQMYFQILYSILELKPI